MEKEDKPKKTNQRGRRIARIITISLASVIALLLLVLLVVGWVLTPQRLTGLVNKYANEYLVNSRLHAQRVELTIWRTFPHAEIDLDSLAIVSTLEQVPTEAQTIASIARFNGRINLAALLIGRIHINNVEIVRPCANIWLGPDSISNLDIFPPSEQAEEEAGELSLPDIRIDRFRIAGDATIRYMAPADSLDAFVTIRATNLDGSDDVPQYQLTTSGRLGANPLLPEPLDFGIDGALAWKPAEPLCIGLQPLRLVVDKVDTETWVEADLSDQILIKSLRFKLNPLPLARIPQLVPELPIIETDAALQLEAKLLKPYVYNPDTLIFPDMAVEAKLGPAPFALPQYHLALTRLAAQISATVSSEGMDHSSVDLRKLEVAFPATAFSLSASATNLQSDPKVKGKFDGNVNFTNVDRRLWRMLGLRLLGRLDADLGFDFKLSDLSVNGFHNARLDGEAHLRDFIAILPSDSLFARANDCKLAFGSSRTLGRGEHVVDSMLTASLSVDSAALFTPDLQARFSHLKVGLGVENTKSTFDSTTVTPMGGVIEVGALRCLLADSTRAVVRNLSGSALITRYRGDGKRPLLAAKFGARRISYSDGTNRVSLSKPEVAASARLMANGERRRRHRELSHADSVRMSHRRDSLILAYAGHENMDFGVDRSMVRMLKKWDVRGRVTAAGARAATPALPLRLRMSNLNFSFNPDTLALNSLKLQAGRSDFALSGQVRNMQQALGRRGSKPLVLDFSLLSDTINANQLVQALFSADASGSKLITDADIELDDNNDLPEDSLTEMRAIVVPSNVDATLSFAAKNIIYSTLLLHDFGGQVIIANGAAHLSDLHAATDIGSAGVDLLYYAPTVKDVDVAMSLELNKFQIGRITELLPTLDSIMPILNSLGGVIDVNIGATTQVDSLLNVDMESLRAMVRLSGDSLKLLDDRTFKTVSKWLLFHDKNKNQIDRMEVELAVEDKTLELYPFMFDFDRYRIGVMGHNDLDLNLDYHISILKSPIPFKFGLNIKGSADKLKIRPGRARFKENMVGQSVAIADTVRLNLAHEIRSALRRGADAARVAPMDVRRPAAMQSIDEAADTLSHADSLYFIQQGIIEAPIDSVPQR